MLILEESSKQILTLPYLFSFFLLARSLLLNQTGRQSARQNEKEGRSSSSR